MKFGKVEDPSKINFTLPKDHPRTQEVLSRNTEGLENISVGAAKWTKSEMKGFYPKGTKDELKYYSTQFNSIELNGTFYGMPAPEQILTWKDKTPANFKFFPKITSTISHYRRLIDVTDHVTQFATSVLNFEEKLGMVFLQLHDNYQPKDYSRLEKFVKEWPKEVPLAIELRNTEWYNNEEIFNITCDLFEEHQITNIIVDTPGRRDMLHMRLTTPTTFIRFVAAGTEIDLTRLDEWVERLTAWKKEGLQNIYFFVHQGFEKDSPLLASYLVKKLNEIWKTDLHIPKMATESIGSLF